MTKVLILGSGASKAFHGEFETGQEMINSICNRTRNDDGYLRKVIEKVEELGNKIDGFHTSLSTYILEEKQQHSTYSIDAFINQQCDKEYAIIAKFMISAHILGYEGASETKETVRNQKFFEKNTWLYELYNYLIKTGFENNPLKIVTFNYDRLLEHHLHLHTPSDKKENLRDFIDKNVFHVYGQTGRLPWQNKNDNIHINYALPNNNESNLLSILKHVSLMYEERQGPQRLKAIKQIIRKATEIYSLGYAYDPFNNYTIDLFYKKPSTIIVANAYGADEKSRIEEVLRNLKPNVVNYKDLASPLTPFQKPSGSGP